MDLFFSSLFSMLMRRLTPSITLCTSSTSEKPRRSELEMSKTLPTAAVSTPPENKKTKILGSRVCACGLLSSNVFYPEIIASEMNTQELQFCVQCSTFRLRFKPSTIMRFKTDNKFSTFPYSFCFYQRLLLFWCWSYPVHIKVYMLENAFMKSQRKTRTGRRLN